MQEPEEEQPEEPENVVKIKKNGAEEILSLIEYLDDWEEGCELCHLLDHWAGNTQLHGLTRNLRFRCWISTYPALFACEPYDNGKRAVKWIGMQCRVVVQIVTKRGTPTDTSPNVASAASSAAQPRSGAKATAVTTRTGSPTRAADGKPSSLKRLPPTGKVYIAGKRMRRPP